MAITLLTLSLQTHKMQNSLETNWTDSEGRQWSCRLSMGLALRFCRTQNIKLESLSYENLNSYQLVELCHASIQHHADAKNYDLEYFMEKMLEGDSYQNAIKAVMYSIVNFSLPRLPEAERVKLIKDITEGDNADQGKDAAETDGDSKTIAE